MSEPLGLAPRERWIYRGLAVLLTLLWLATLAARPLFNPDEGRYAEIPREMQSAGDWVIPHLNGLAYIEKPPLQYWATAVSYRLLGPSEFAARLYTALTALATILLAWLAARRLWGLEAGWRAAAVLSGMLLFVVLGQLLTTPGGVYRSFSPSPCPGTGSRRGASMISWSSSSCTSMWRGI